MVNVENQWTTSPALEMLMRSIRDMVGQMEHEKAKALATAKVERLNVDQARKRIAELEKSRVGLKAVVVALTERLVRLEARMANAGDPPPPLTHKEADAIHSLPADVRDRALKVAVATHDDDEFKARGAMGKSGGQITAERHFTDLNGFSGNPF